MNKPNPLGPHNLSNAFPQSQPSMDDDFIDLGRLLRVLLRQKWGILGLAFVITIVTALVVYRMEPVYRASATIALEGAEANLVNVEQVYSINPAQYEYAMTEYEILKSRSLAERVVRKLKLYEHPDFLPSEEAIEEPWYQIN
ncbi:MAG: Wzz/FepE/Etk N-terminal domain-containing protein, partial [Cyanobacteria bacterium P01_F01_bin.53]